MAQDLRALPNRLDAEKRQCIAIVETPKDHRNKFSSDPETHLFQLKFPLPQGMAFPFDFGFIPRRRVVTATHSTSWSRWTNRRT